MREAGGLLFVSGVSARRADNSVEGASLDSSEAPLLDIRVQTRAVIENLRIVLQRARADLDCLLNITAYLASMDDYAGYNEVYNRYFTASHGPARTTVAVRSLPGPHLLIEMSAVALAPRGSAGKRAAESQS